jgi:hypothetical protein
MYTFVTNPKGVTSSGLDFIDDANFDEESLQTMRFMWKIRDSKVPFEFHVQAICGVKRVDENGKDTATSNIHIFDEQLLSTEYRNYPFFAYMSADMEGLWSLGLNKCLVSKWTRLIFFSVTAGDTISNPSKKGPSNTLMVVASSSSANSLKRK